VKMLLRNTRSRERVRWRACSTRTAPSRSGNERL
jgi:hypothetical protein